MDWMTCPVCGVRAIIIEGGVASMLGMGRRVARDDPEYATLPFGQEGTEWYGWEIESDSIKWPAPCPGYKVWLGAPDGNMDGDLVPSFAHLTEEEL